MNHVNRSLIAVILCLFSALVAFGQTHPQTGARPAEAFPALSGPAAHGAAGSSATVASSPQAAVPRLMKFSGVLHDAAGKPLTGTVDVTFSLYNTEAGGEPLWFETQSVQVDELGRYTALVGAMHTEGLPIDLFASGEVRWLGIRVGAEAEQQPRVLLVSVPYALKAGDAETLGGKPASAYMLSDSQGASASTGVTVLAAGAIRESGAVKDQTKSITPKASPLTGCASVTTDGTETANTLAKFSATTCQIQNSAITEVGGQVGIGTSSPGNFTLDITSSNNASVRLRGPGTHQYSISGATNGRLGQDSAGFFFASDTNGAALRFLTNNGSLNEWMRINSGGSVGIGTTTPAAKLDVVGDINSSGTVTAGFLSGDGSQLTNLPIATGLSCGGCIGNSQLGVNYAASNAQSGDALNAMALGGMPAAAFPMTTSSNTFTQTQNVSTGAGTALTATTNDAGGAAIVLSNANLGGDALVVTDPGTPILRISAVGNLTTIGTFQGSNFNASSTNDFVGANIGNSTMTGTSNVGIGYQILGANTTGISNVSTGFYALNANTKGSHNVATGYGALAKSTTGNYNAAVGSFSLNNNTTAGGNTAIGYAALNLNCRAISTGCAGSYNTALGYLAGVTGNSANANVSGSNNTFIGYNSGPGTSTPINNATAIGENAQVSASNALVLGGTGGDAVNVGIGTPTPAVTLQVVGDIRVGTSGTNGCLQNFSGSPLSGSCSSDARLKTDIQPFSSLLDKVARLQPVHYHWRVTEHPEYHFGSALISGLVAQDVEKVFPDMVSEDARGFKTVNYSELPFLLLESVRELKAENDDLRAQIKSHEASAAKDDEIAELRHEIAELRALVTHSAEKDNSHPAQPSK
jgi:hypothetical protein